MGTGVQLFKMHLKTLHLSGCMKYIYVQKMDYPCWAQICMVGCSGLIRLACALLYSYLGLGSIEYNRIYFSINTYRFVPICMYQNLCPIEQSEACMHHYCLFYSHPHYVPGAFPDHHLVPFIYINYSLEL